MTDTLYKGGKIFSMAAVEVAIFKPESACQSARVWCHETFGLEWNHDGPGQYPRFVWSAVRARTEPGELGFETQDVWWIEGRIVKFTFGFGNKEDAILFKLVCG